MSSLRLSGYVKLWSVYIMAAPALKGLTYFKVGVTSDITKRICGVQTGCPLRIARVWAITVGANGHAQAVESAMHATLKPFHSHGEWFAMETDNLDHKRAMSEAMALGAGLATGPKDGKWRQLEIPDIKAAARAVASEQADESRRRAKSQAMKAKIAMAQRGRRVL